MGFSVGLQKIVQGKDRMHCIGPSMRPTLKPGDLLIISPYSGREPRVGDVVVFQTPGVTELVSHRVMSVTASGVRTRGDNNAREDPYLIDDEDILGRVTHAVRGKSRKTISGGRAGLLRARLLHVRRRVMPMARTVLGFPYRLLYRQGVLQQLLGRFFPTRVVAFRRRDGTELQLILGKHTIGRLPPGAAQWIIVPPYKLLVQEEELPLHPSSRAKSVFGLQHRH